VRIPDPFHSYSLTAIHSPVFVISASVYNQAPRFDVVGGSLVGRRLTNRAGGVVVVTSGVSRANVFGVFRLLLPNLFSLKVQHTHTSRQLKHHPLVLFLRSTPVGIHPGLI
jgi:hypothetical protein